MRGVGLVEMATAQDVPVALYSSISTATPERLPEPGETRMLAGVPIPTVGARPALEASAPLKVEAALRLFGLAG